MQNAPVPTLLPVYKRADLDFERGEGVWLWTRDGRRFLDFGTGIAVSGLGHAHPHLVEALTAQARKVWHVSNLYRIDAAERLADRLVAQSFADTVFFCNSGAEAMEACIKMVRRFHHQRGAPERNRIITFEGCFHGRTMATISAAGGAKLTEGFAPLLDGFDHVPLGDLDAVRAAIGPTTAGIMIEPIQGEGGIRPVAPAFLKGLRELADAHDLLLVFDEIQCGMGRTGRLFAHQAAGVTPDVMGLAKGLGNGVPIGACLATARAASGMTAGSHGSTFGGNPLVCAVGNAVLDVLLADGFLERVKARGETLRAGLSRLAAAYPQVIAEVRGAGLMAGLRLVPPNDVVTTRLREAGLLVVPAADNVIRLLPPLIVEDEDIEAALAILDGVCREWPA
jgi:acetylornithine/N-succinyldiaminopimelate aminotransferase